MGKTQPSNIISLSFQFNVPWPTVKMSNFRSFSSYDTLVNALFFYPYTKHMCGAVSKPGLMYRNDALYTESHHNIITICPYNPFCWSTG